MACFLTTVYVIIKYYFMAHFVQETNKHYQKISKFWPKSWVNSLEKSPILQLFKIDFFIVKKVLLFN